MKNSVTLSNVFVKRRFTTILEIDRLVIPFRQFAGLIGPNGSGKTTLLKLCCGVIKPDKGNVCLESKRIGYIPQQADYNAHLPFTLREIVAMGRNVLKPLACRLDKTDYEKVDFWISRMGLYERRQQSFRSLSGGQQQKTLIARAMVAEPDFVFLDEPGANLDPAWKRQLKDILNRLFEENAMSILLISHELDWIPESCQRLILLNAGRVAADGLPAEVLDVSTTRQVFENTLVNGQKG
jgi:ABC-type Mn2+/Zn2+ transport system ATPase subunit